ncbi:MAG: GNAT family N-acetyltransferase [Thermodesulfobacteriota bacterium]
MTTSYSFLNLPTATDLGQIIAIYRAQGWWFVDRDAPEIAEGIIRGSHCFATARDNGRIVGMGRAISDGVSDAYIQDVAVLEPFRNTGIGGRLIACIVERLRADGLDWIGLIAEPGSHRFYQRLGFFPLQDAQPMLWNPDHEFRRTDNSHKS